MKSLTRILQRISSARFNGGTSTVRREILLRALPKCRLVWSKLLLLVDGIRVTEILTFIICCLICHSASANTTLAHDAPLAQTVRDFRSFGPHCPGGLALQIPREFGPRGGAGGYIPCETLQKFLSLLESGSETQALKLLIAPAGTAESYGR